MNSNGKTEMLITYVRRMERMWERVNQIMGSITLLSKCKIKWKIVLNEVEKNKPKTRHTLYIYVYNVRQWRATINKKNL